MKRGFALRRVSFLLAGGLCAVAVLVARTSPTGSAERMIDMDGTVLIYEPDRGAASDTKERLAAVKLDRLVEVLESRVDADKVIVRRGEGEQIEVLIAGTDPQEVQRIQGLLERSGTLAFRILANTRDHKEIIERALAEKTPILKSKTKDDNGDFPAIAEWVRLDGSERLKDKAHREAAEAKLADAAKERLSRDKKRVAGLLDYPEICKRTIEQGDKEIDEVLVCRDAQNVTGQYLVETAPGIDRQGRPCINFRFGREGAARFAALTGNNLPEQGGEFTRKLGIIIDGRLHSAPAIRSTISDRGEITGEFTQKEAKDLVNVLSAGALPVKLKLVEKRVDK